MECKILKTSLGLVLQSLAVIVNASAAILYSTLKGVSAEYFTLYVYIHQASVLTPYVTLKSTKADFTQRLFKEKYTHLVRSVSAVICFLLVTESARLIPVSEIFAIGKTIPCFVTVLAYFLLKERIGIFRIVLLCLISCGVVLYCRPRFVFKSEDISNLKTNPLGYLYSLCGAFLMSIAYICQKKIRETPVAVSLLANAIVGVLLSLSVTTWRSTWCQLECMNFPVVFALNAMYMAVIILKFVASRIEDASRLATVVVLDLPFTAAVEMLAFGARISWTRLAGVFIIIFSIVALFVLKNRETRVPNSNHDGEDVNSEVQAQTSQTTNLRKETSV